MRAVMWIFGILFSTASLANGYCESRGTPRAISQCYSALSQSEVGRMNGLYEKIRNHPAITQDALQQLEFDHQNWAGMMDASCRDSRCGYTALVNRNNMLDSRLNGLGPAESSNAAPGNCLDAWISAFRSELGDEVPIGIEQLNEWEDWCASGQYP